MSSPADIPTDTSIAIIGMAGRFPGAANIQAYWANLTAGRDCITIHDRQKLQAAGLSRELLDHPGFVPATATLEGIDRFDAAFFNFSPREAETMDPQQRLMLECAWAALEDAGYDATAIAEAVGVYCGGGLSSYLLTNLLGHPGVDPIHLITGNDKDFLATRISHKLNLRGPSMATQTACSSSLVAVHVACQALLANECDVALAGGVMVSVTSGPGYIFQEGGVLSRDGRCRAFDRDATGTVSGNGVGLVVLKPLAAARRDGDPIYAVIRGTAINNDGSRKVGFTAPSAECQRDVILEAMSVAGVSADEISYIEAHGTGTRLGDVIEMKALTEAFRRSTRRTGFCAIGSVKTNIGHLDAAAGIAGLIKTTLALQHRTLPASLNFQEPNPEIALAESPFRVQAATTPWTVTTGERLAGVSSFGIGGTNAHVILQEAPPPGGATGQPSRRLLRFSARSSEQVKQQAERLREHWTQRTSLPLSDVTATLATGRATFAHRGVVFAEAREQALAALESGRFDALASVPERRDPSVALWFADRPLAPDIAVRLFREHGEFRAVVLAGLEELPDATGAAGRAYFSGGSPASGGATAEIALLGNLALARLLQAWGVTPCAAVGFGAGRLAAACFSGALSVATALRLLHGHTPVTDFAPGSFPVYCGATGAPLSAALLTAGFDAPVSSPAAGVAALRAQTPTVVAAIGASGELAATLATGTTEWGKIVFPADGLVPAASQDRAWWTALGALWAHGIDLRWSEIERGAGGSRVSLPTYPFAPHSHWVARAKPAPATPATRLTNLSDWCLQPGWKRTGRGQPAEVAGEFDLLILGDTDALATGVADVLRGDARRVVTAGFGERRCRVAPDACTIAAGNPDDYRWLVDEVLGTAAARWKVVHLGNLSVTPETAPRHVLEHGFYSVTFLAQAMAAGDFLADEKRSVELLILTSEQADVWGRESIVPEVSCLTGPVRVIPQEYPGMRCRWIDLETLATYRSDRAATRRLEEELRVANGPSIVALRGHHRWLPEFEPVVLADDEGYRQKIKRDGVYVITGGCGGLGLEFARFLAETERVRLALVGRSVLPPRAEWPALLAAESATPAAGAIGNDAAIREKVRKISAIEALGSEVLVVVADVASPSALAEAKARITRELGPVNGLIHAAGLPFNGLSVHKTREQLAAILAPKVEGLRALDACFDFPRLDFVVLCSSLRSLTGGLGNLDYTAANAYLDAFARQQHALGRSACVAINWDGWSEVGHGQRAEAGDSAVEIRSTEGVEILRRSLGSTVPQIIVSTRPLAAVLQAFSQIDVLRRRLPAGPPATPAAAVSDAAVAGASPAEILRTIWQDCLGLTNVGLDDNFFELGGDSIVSIQVMAKAKAHGLSFTSKALYDYPTVRELAGAVGPASTPAAVAPVTPGPVPLLASQSWFFESAQPHPSWWNISQVVRPGRALDPELLRRALQAVVAHHDALSLRFRPTPAGWEQALPADSSTADLRVVDLRGVAPEEISARMLAEVGQTHASIDLDGGSLFKLVLFTTGQPEGDLLAVVSHHLIIDYVSWQIVIEDLRSAYESLAHGRAVGPLPRSTSFSQWARRLAEHAQTGDWSGAEAHWRTMAAAPLDRLALAPLAAGTNTVRQTRRVTGALDADETERLINGVPQRYGADVLAVLVAAVGRATHEQFGAGRFLLGTEAHGREQRFADLDLSRSVGWFTSVYPLLVDVADRPGPGPLLARANESVRAAARHGFDYGVLRYLRRDPAVVGLPRAEIELNYLGAAGLPRDAAPQRPWRIENFGNQVGRHADNERDYAIQITVAVLQGRLLVSLEDSAGVQDADAAEAYLARLLTEIRTLVHYCEEHPREGFGPLEIDASIPAAELDDLLQELAAT